MKTPCRAGIAGLLLALTASAASAQTPTPRPVLGGPLSVPLPLFPADNWWNQDVSAAPIDPRSAAMIAFVNNGTTPGRRLHPDFGGIADPATQSAYGIPYIVVGSGQPKKAVQFEYWDESDGVNMSTGVGFPFYPIPDEAITQPYWIEGGPPGNVDVGGDRHMLIIDKDNNHLYELFALHWDGVEWRAGSGAFFNMNTNNRRPEGWTSADAAGLAILPGLVRYDEVFGTSAILHAFRVTVRATNGHVYPGSHTACGACPMDALPMGARLRLKASKDLSGYTPEMRRIFQAMKTYGLIVADNGSDMYISGTHDTRWNNDVLNPAFRSLNASDFDVIQLGWRPTGPTPTPTSTPTPRPTSTPTATSAPTITPTPTATPIPTSTPTPRPRPAGPTVLVNGSSAPITVAPGVTVTVAVSGGPAFRHDWVGQYVSTAVHPGNPFLAWKYLNNTQVAPATGTSAASLTFAMPSAPGTYNFRFFQNDAYTLLATSPLVTVSGGPAPTATPTAVPGGPTVLVNGSSSPLTVALGATVNVAVSGGPAFRHDWVGQYVSTAVHPTNPFVAWKYLNNTQVAPAAGMSAATLTFVMSSAGTYNFRFFQNDGYTLLATSAAITVGGTAPTATPTPRPTPPAGAAVLVNGSAAPITVTRGASVTVAVSGGPALPLDWVGQYVSTAVHPGQPFLAWKYLSNTQAPPASGLASATLTFTMPTTPGSYNFRFFRDDGYVLLATSPTVTVP
jgi:hypothetical protein